VRLAIISDTHMPRGGRALPPACVEHLRAADLILHAGDFMELSVLEDLQALGPPVHAVRGNVDSAQLQARLPLTRIVAAEAVKIAMIHDAGPSDRRLERLRRRFPEANAVVFGHSHLPLLENDAGFTIFNPGSPTERRRAPRHTMGLATADHGRVTFEHVPLD
jgi:putative phosphoesterase